MFDKNWIVGILRGLIERQSVNPPGNEENIAEHISGLLNKIGLDSRLDYLGEGRANVIGILHFNGSGPTLVLNGHLDTVPVKEDWSYDPFKGKIDRGKIYGLGASDMKGGIASMIGAVKRLKESREKLNGTLILSFVADEERNNLGTLRFLEKYSNLDYAIIGEPTNLKIVTSNRGVMRFALNTLGRAAHVSNPGNGINAIYEMNRVLTKLIAYAEDIGSQKGNYWEKPSMSVSMIRGGSGENIIPDTCQIVIDRRTVYTEKRADVENEIGEMFREIEKEDPQFKFSLEKIRELKAWKSRENSSLLKYGLSSYMKCFGKPPDFTDLGATCEAALFAERGVDTFVFGPGSIEQAHTKDEYIEIDQLIEAAEYYYAISKEVLA